MVCGAACFVGPEYFRMEPGTALDIGAAGGGNTRVLLARGWAAFALEYGLAGAEVAKDRGIPVIRADGCLLPLRSNCLDLVIAFDVLEHIQDDKGAANEIARVLRPGGTALIAVPADPRLWSAHDEAVGHQRRYTRETLSATLLSAGLVLEHLSSWNVLLRPIAAWRRRRATGSDLQRLPAAVEPRTTSDRRHRTVPSPCQTAGGFTNGACAESLKWLPQCAHMGRYFGSFSFTVWTPVPRGVQERAARVRGHHRGCRSRLSRPDVSGCAKITLRHIPPTSPGRATGPSR